MQRVLTLTGALMTLTLAASVSAEPIVVPLGDHSGPSNEVTVDRHDTPRPNRWVSHVTQATLSVYQPAETKGATAAVVVCPGGGYAGLAYDKEGTYVAEWLAERGVAAGLLKYHAGDRGESRHPAPLNDALAAIALMRSRAAEWRLDPQRIGVMGFSAGGHLAASASTLFEEASRPDFSVLVYPVISMQPGTTHGGSRANLLGPDPSDELVRKLSLANSVTPKTPPTFVVHAADDGAVPLANSLEYIAACRGVGVPVEAHLFEHGGHGFGMWNDQGTVSQWPTLLEAWLRQRGAIR